MRPREEDLDSDDDGEGPSSSSSSSFSSSSSSPTPFSSPPSDAADDSDGDSEDGGESAHVLVTLPPCAAVACRASTRSQRDGSHRLAAKEHTRATHSRRPALLIAQRLTAPTPLRSATQKGEHRRGLLKAQGRSADQASQRSVAAL